MANEIQLWKQPHFPTLDFAHCLANKLKSSGCNDGKLILEIVKKVLNENSDSSKPSRYGHYKYLPVTVGDRLDIYLYPTKIGKSKTSRMKTFSPNAVRVSINLPTLALIQTTKVARLSVDLSSNAPHFSREIGMLHYLDDTQGVVQLYHSAVYEGSRGREKCFKGLMFQELYDENLTSYLERTQPVNFNDRKELFKELLKALIALQERSVIHNDLKPDNIFCKQMGDGCLIVSIGDLEFAFRPDDDENIIKGCLTRGSPGFISPERFSYLQDSKTNPKPGLPSDVWSIGLVMHRIYHDEWPDVCERMSDIYDVLEKVKKHKNNKPLKNKAIADYEEKRKLLHSTFEKMKNEMPVSINSIQDLICWMLHPNPDKRLTPRKALSLLEPEIAP